MRYEIEKVESSDSNPARYIWIRVYDDSFSEPRLVLLDYGNMGDVLWANVFGGYRGGGNHTVKIDDLVYAGIMPNDYSAVAEYAVKRFYKIG